MRIYKKVIYVLNELLYQTQVTSVLILWCTEIFNRGSHPIFLKNKVLEPPLKILEHHDSTALVTHVGMGIV